MSALPVDRKVGSKPPPRASDLAKSRLSTPAAPQLNQLPSMTGRMSLRLPPLDPNSKHAAHAAVPTQNVNMDSLAFAIDAVREMRMKLAQKKMERQREPIRERSGEPGKYDQIDADMPYSYGGNDGSGLDDTDYHHLTSSMSGGGLGVEVVDSGLATVRHHRSFRIRNDDLTDYDNRQEEYVVSQMQRLVTLERLHSQMPDDDEPSPKKHSHLEPVREKKLTIIYECNRSAPTKGPPRQTNNPRRSQANLGFETTTVSRPVVSSPHFDVDNIQLAMLEVVVGNIQSPDFSVNSIDRCTRVIVRDVLSRVIHISRARNSQALLEDSEDEEDHGHRADKYKFLVLCVMTERKGGGGLTMDCGCLWDRRKDGSVTVRWDSPQIHCVTTVYGVFGE